MPTVVDGKPGAEVKIRSVMDDSYSRGKASVSSDKLTVEIDTDEIARSLAETGRAVLTEHIRGGGPMASESTLRARRRKGVTGTRAFHATGRLATELDVVRRADGSYEIQAPPGYLADERLVQKFVEQILTGAFETKLESSVDQEIADETKDIVKVRKGARGY